MPLLDLIQFSRELASRRNKAALLLTPDLREQHAIAAHLAGALSAPHLDVLDRFQADPMLADQISVFSSIDLFKLIAAQKSQPLLVISGIEFLLAAWIAQGDAKEVKRSFCQQVELWDCKPAFLLVTHHDPFFVAYEPRRHTGRLIIELSKTLSLARKTPACSAPCSSTKSSATSPARTTPRGGSSL